MFKNNNLFYINKKPYTIVNSRWKPENWQIDKKPIEKLLSQFSHLTQKQLQQELQQEENDIPEIIRPGLWFMLGMPRPPVHVYRSCVLHPEMVLFPDEF